MREAASHVIDGRVTRGITYKPIADAILALPLPSAAEAASPAVICAGCGSRWTDEQLLAEKAKNPLIVSCCPERKPLTIEQWAERSNGFEGKLRENIQAATELSGLHADLHGIRRGQSSRGNNQVQAGPASLMVPEAASPAAGWLVSDTTSSAAPKATHRHYKGDLIAVVSEVTDEETLEPRIIYMHNGKLWDRRKAVFEQSVTWQGKSVPRFIPLPASPSEEAMAG